MGQRSKNFIALQPGVQLTPEVSSYLNGDTADILTDGRGTLILYESNVTPMWARDSLGATGTRDLEQELAVQRFLGGLTPKSFFMKRLGETCETRGAWIDHAFMTHASVLERDQPDAPSNSAPAFNPSGDFDSPEDALRQIFSQPVPIDALLALVKAQLEMDESGFASDVVRDFNSMDPNHALSNVESVDGGPWQALSTPAAALQGAA